MASSVPNARNALYTLLNSLNLPNMPVEWEGVLNQDPYKQRVMILNTPLVERGPWALGRTSVHENYVIPVRVEVVQRTTDMTATETLMWQAVATIEQAIINAAPNPLGIAEAVPAGIPDGVVTGMVDNDRMTSVATLRIECFDSVALT